MIGNETRADAIERWNKYASILRGAGTKVGSLTTKTDCPRAIRGAARMICATIDNALALLGILMTTELDAEACESGE